MFYIILIGTMATKSPVGTKHQLVAINDLVYYQTANITYSLVLKLWISLSDCLIKDPRISLAVLRHPFDCEFYMRRHECCGGPTH